MKTLGVENFRPKEPELSVSEACQLEPKALRGVGSQSGLHDVEGEPFCAQGLGDQSQSSALVGTRITCGNPPFSQSLSAVAFGVEIWSVPYQTVSGTGIVYPSPHLSALAQGLKLSSPRYQETETL